MWKAAFASLALGLAPVRAQVVEVAGTPAPPALPAADAALASPEAPDLLQDLEKRVLSAIDLKEPPMAEAWKLEIARRLRDDPSARLVDVMGQAFSEVHRLDPSKARLAAGLLKDGPRGRAVPDSAAKRLFSPQGRLYACIEDTLKRFAGDGFDDIQGLPPMEFRDLQSFGGKLHAAGERGVYAQEGGDWRKLGGLDAHSLLRHDGLLYVGTEKGLYRFDGRSWRRDRSLPKAAVYHLVQLDGRFYASTAKGLYEGSPAAKAAPPAGTFAFVRGWLERVRLLMFGPRTIDWNPSPMFRKVERKTETDGYGGSSQVDYDVRAFQAALVEGRLRLATEKGVFLRQGDGNWRHELRDEPVHRLVETSDGAFALARSEAKRRVSGSWTDSFRGWGSALRDLVELDGVLYAATEEGVRILVALPDAWERAAIDSINRAASAAPAPAPTDALRADEKRIVDRSGRSVLDAN